MDRVLYSNSATQVVLGLAWALVPQRTGWRLFENEGCQYFQLNSRQFGVAALALGILNYTHTFGNVPKSMKTQMHQVMLGVNVATVVFSGWKFSLFTPVAASILIAVNLLLAGANGYFGFLRPEKLD